MFVDIDFDTINIDVDKIEAAINSGDRMTILALAGELDGYNSGSHFVNWDWVIIP